MGKTVEGYVLDIDTAAGIPGATVTIYDANTNSALSGVVGLSTNPVNTDANGHFKFTMDLSPGPVYVDAANGGKHDRRMGLEQMQIGDHWMSDIPTLLHLFTDGVIRGVLNEFAVSVSGSINQFTVATGEAIIQGHAWSLSSGAYTASIAANTTIANRRSIVVLRQFLDAAYQGKQVIDIIYGTVDGVDPTLKQGVDDGSGNTIWEFPLATLNTVQNAGISTIVADDRVFTVPQTVSISRQQTDVAYDFHQQDQSNWVLTNNDHIAQWEDDLPDHPGVIALITAATNNYVVSAFNSGHYEQRLQFAEWEVQFVSAAATVRYLIGLFTGPPNTASYAPSSGVGIELDTAKSDSALSLVKYVAGTRTVAATMTFSNTDWFRIEWTRTASGAGSLKLTNLTSLAVQSAAITGLAANAQWYAGFLIAALTNSQRIMYVDWYRRRLSGMTR